jgi:hypothetical protein
MFLHHAVIGYPLNGLQVDHIDGNGLNNRRENLRIVTHRQNHQNKKCHRAGGKKSSRFLGVRLHKASGLWQTRIWINGKELSLGYFHDEQKAGDAYQKALLKLKK